MAEPPVTIRALHNSGTGNTPPTRVVIHSTVGGGFPGASRAGVAANVARYFQQSSAGGSAHYIVDVGEEIHCLPDNVVAWHAPPNPHSIGIEIASEPTYTRDQWLSPEVWPAVQRAAARTRELCDRFGIPKVRLSSADLLAGRHGICGHVDVSNAWHQSTHWDPGPNFPWDRFMAEVLGGGAIAAPSLGPVPAEAPPKLAWILPSDEYIGDVDDPSLKCHGGDPNYDSDAVRALIENAQRWLIYHGATSVPRDQWKTSGWADGTFSRPYSTDAAVAWHARLYPGQPYPDQIWSDDYDRLATPEQPAPTPPPTPDPEEDMPTAAEIAHAVWWDTTVARADADGNLQQIPVIQEVADAKTQAIAANAALAAVVKELAEAKGFDANAVAAAVEGAVKKALDESTVHVDINVAGGEQPA